MRARYDQYLERAAYRGIKVTHHAARACSVTRGKDDCYEVRLDDGSELTFTHVVISARATRYKVADGFQKHLDRPRLISSPYPVTRLRQRIGHSSSRVLVLGTGLSGIDATIALCHDGHNVTMASRSGVLPAVRDHIAPTPQAMPSLDGIVDLDPNGPLLDRKIARMVVQAIRTVSKLPLRHQLSSATDPAQRLREEVDLLSAGRCPWQEIVVAIVDNVIAWTIGLPLATQTSLMSRYRPITWRYVNSMAVDNAKILVQHLDSQQLTLDTYDPPRVIARDSHFDVQLGRSGKQSFDHVVTAVGVQAPPVHVDSGTIYLTDAAPTAAPLGHLDRDLRVRLSHKSPPENVWLVGQVTHMQTFWAHILVLNAIQANKVAYQLTASTSGRKGPLPSLDSIIMPSTWNAYGD